MEEEILKIIKAEIGEAKYFVDSNYKRGYLRALETIASRVSRVDKPVKPEIAEVVEMWIVKTKEAMEDQCNYNANGEYLHAQLVGRLNALQDFLGLCK